MSLTFGQKLIGLGLVLAVLVLVVLRSPPPPSRNPRIILMQAEVESLTTALARADSLLQAEAAARLQAEARLQVTRREAASEARAAAAQLAELERVWQDSAATAGQLRTALGVATERISGLLVSHDAVARDLDRALAAGAAERLASQRRQADADSVIAVQARLIESLQVPAPACRILWVIPCPSPPVTVVLTMAGTLILTAIIAG